MIVVAYGALFLLLIAVAGLWMSRRFVMAIPLVDPHPQGRRVHESGVLGNYYPTISADARPGVLIIGGSEGGIDGQADRDARTISQEGYSVLALSFFRGPGQPDKLALIPLELFDRALDWLKQQPGVADSPLAMIGMSKGAEAVLLMATRRPDLEAVVAAVPSSVVWPGFDWWRFRGLKESSWSQEGRPLPMLPYGRFHWRKGVRSIYDEGLRSIGSHPAAVIPIELSKAAVLLICGGLDQVWPSCLMAEQIVAQGRKLDGPRIEILSYLAADHGVFSSPLKPGEKPRRFGSGPPARGNTAAQADSWRQALSFLKDNL